MGKGKQISSPVKKLIIKSVESNKSYSQIANQFNVSKTAIGQLVQRYRVQGTTKYKQRTGRPKLMSDREIKMLVKMSNEDPRKSAVLLNAEMLKFYRVKCSVATTQRVLRKALLFGRRPVKKPLVSLKNRKARLEFAKKHLDWTPNQWAKVLWSDESKFMLFGSDGIKYVRRPAGERFNPKYQLPTVKHGGGNIMVWGCFSRDGIGPIHRVEGIMDQYMYKDIINNKMLPHAKDKLPRGWVFQQDNDPKHTAVSVKNFFASKKIRVLDWPSQSPDLNPIEHIWEHVDRQLRGRKPTNKDELFSLIKSEWSKIPLDVLIKLVDSMPRRCQAVIDAKGYPTKY